MAPCFNYICFLHTLFFFAFMLLIITCTGSLSLFSHDDECLALYQFKQSINLHQDHASFSSPLDSWKITSNATDNVGGAHSDCCLWEGVACSNEEEEGHVIGLDLSNSFLHGPINSNTTLFSLVHLQILNLAGNDFVETQIPSEIGRLKQLTNLNLSGSGFSGQIPSEVGELIQLSSLDLSQNPLKLQIPSFEKLAQNLSQLEELDLSGVDISSSVPRFLANVSSLRSILLKQCGLRNEFPTAIFHLPKLKFLDVSFNVNLTGSFPDVRNKSLFEELYLYSTGFFGIIPESISSLNHLKYLNLGRSSFSGRIPSSLSNLTQLIGLGIAYNEFTSHVPSFVSLSELNILDISGNEFEKGCLPDWLGELTKLNQLYAYEMNLNSDIPAFLANLTKLTAVEMGKNSLFGHIPSSVFNLTQLRLLSFGDNQLQGEISSSFSNFENLQDLRLQANNFSGKVDLDMFLELNKLETLVLGQNSISLVATNNYTNGTLPQLKIIDLKSCNLKEFPAFLRFQYQMELLMLEDNNIDGIVPAWGWKKSKETLRVLDLSRNHITGTLPIPPQKIVIYAVSNNNLKGKISPLMCELKLLQVLDLSSNNMSGALPPCFGSLSNSLLFLDLNRNNFQGTMMNAFTHGSPLKNIDLSENQFTGRVSKSLANCTNLEFLSLGDNSFNDVFPFWLGTLPELQVLILRSNKFYGSIQGLATVSSQFPKLRIIDLSNNGFRGQLPENYFLTWNAMKSSYAAKSFSMMFMMLFGEIHWNKTYSMTLTYKGQKTEYKRILNIFVAIDLSCNNFQGQIPQSLQDLQGLESLNLSNNHFTGGVLPSLGNLANLESLDLSENELSGEIPQQLLQLGFLAIFNVSFNRLHGRIPKGKQFNTFENNSYKGNPGLCGTPLSKECQNSRASITPPLTNSKSESLFPSERLDWIVIFLGFVSGLAVGIVMGNLVYTRYSDWFIERFVMSKDKWVRPLSSKRRIQVRS